MNNGDNYVVYSSNTLYRLLNSSCSEGDTVQLQNSLVERVFLVNGKWLQADNYVTSSYTSSSYICHVWGEQSPVLNISDLILPATLLVICFFAIIYRWYIRLRG